MRHKKFGNPGTTFSERVVTFAQRIPKGRVITYGTLSRFAGGGDMAAQSITSILGKAYNRGVTNIPFHRIVYAGGRIWIDEQHRSERMKKYKAEGIRINARDHIENFADVAITEVSELSKD